MSPPRPATSIRALLLLSLASCASDNRATYQLTRPPQTRARPTRAAGAASTSSQVDSASKAGKSILLVFTNDKLPGHKETVAAAHAYADGHRDTITAIVADPETETELAKRCRIPGPLDQVRVAILIKGRVVVHAVAPDTKQAVADAYRYAVARSKCTRCGF